MAHFEIKHSVKNQQKRGAAHPKDLPRWFWCPGDCSKCERVSYHSVAKKDCTGSFKTRRDAERDLEQVSDAHHCRRRRRHASLTDQE